MGVAILTTVLREVYGLISLHASPRFAKFNPA
jgi:hypothetical protein